MEKFALLAGITFIAMASPGPDMLLLIRNGLTEVRRVGFATVTFIRRRLSRFNPLIDRIFGGAMIALGLRSALVRD